MTDRANDVGFMKSYLERATECERFAYIWKRSVEQIQGAITSLQRKESSLSSQLRTNYNKEYQLIHYDAVKAAATAEARQYKAEISRSEPGCSVLFATVLAVFVSLDCLVGGIYIIITAATSGDV